MTQAYEQAFSDGGLNSMQFFLLVAVANAGPTPISVLADHLQLDRTTLTRNLAGLVDDQWVQVCIDPEDRRSRVVKVTTRGLAAIEKSYERWEAAQREVTRHLGAQLIPLVKGLAHLSALK